MGKVTSTDIVIPKKPVVSVAVGQTVTSTSGEHTVTEINETENATYIKVGEMWYGSKIFLEKFK